MVTLKTLHIHNFMSIEDLSMDFDDETIISISSQHNGAGKSAMLYALAAVLCNYRAGESFRDYVRINSEDDTARIELYADLLGEPLYCELEIYGNTKKYGNPTKRKTVYKGEEYLNSDHTQFMSTYGLDNITDIMFSFSSDGKNIINARPTERAATLRRLFKFDFSDIVEKFKEKQEQGKLSNLEVASAIRELQSRTFDTQPLLREVVPAAVEQWQNRVKEINDNLIKIGNVDEESLNKIEDEIVSTQNQINTTTGKIDVDKATLKSIEQSISTSESLIKEHDVVNIKETIDKLKIKKDEHEKLYETTRTTVEELTKELSIHNYEINETTKQIEISKGGVCHACGQPIGEDHIKKLEDKKERLLEEAENTKKTIANINFDYSDKEGKDIDGEIKTNEDLLKKIDSETRNLTYYQTRLNETKGFIEDRKSYVESLENKKASLMRDKEKLEELKPIFKQKEELQRELDQLNEKITAARDNSIKNNERKASNDNILREKKITEERLQELNDRSNSILMSLSNTKECIDFFENSFPSYCILQATQKLEDFINSIVQRVFPYCEVKLRMISKGVAFYYTPYNSEGKYLPVCNASAAQQSIISLAYRIALAKLSGLQLVCLDEIDAACSKESAEAIYNLIAGLDFFNQIIFISHRSESIAAVKAVNPNVVAYTVENGEYSLVEA